MIWKTCLVLAGPLWFRLLRGEGGMLAINFFVIALLPPFTGSWWFQGVLSVGVLASLYSFNDWHDRNRDRENPKKNQPLVSIFIEHEQRWLKLLIVSGVAWVLLSGWVLGLNSALAVLAVLSINVAYSLYWKSLPLVDIVSVGFWGMAYVMILGVPLNWEILIIIALMTGICHIHQILSDVNVDRQTGIQTTAVFSHRVLQISLIGCYLGVAAINSLGWVYAPTVLLPMVASLGMLPNGWAWMLTRAYFAFIWLGYWKQGLLFV